MRCPTWLYRHIDRRGYLYRWVRRIWRSTHWCPEMDGLLIIDNIEDCFCEFARQPEKVCTCCLSLRERRTLDINGICIECRGGYDLP